MTDIQTILRDKKFMLATAESCTGGLIAKIVTDQPGSSAVFERGFVTYSNEAKVEMLGVHAELINVHGAVSPEVAQAMAQGALKKSRADITISCTGIAGPGGATETKPVGLVYIGLASKDHVISFKHIFSGDRESVREQTAQKALQHLKDALA